MSRDLGVSLFRTKYRLEWRHGFTRSEARKCMWLHKICIDGRKRKPFLKRKNFCLKFIVLGCNSPCIFTILLPILSLFTAILLLWMLFTFLAFIYVFPTEWTLSISSWIIYFSRICPFFTRWEVLSLSSSISFQVNSYRFFWAINSYILLCFFLLLVFSSRPLCPKQKIFADILRPCGTTIRHVLIVFIVPGKTPAKFVVPGLWAHG